MPKGGQHVVPRGNGKWAVRRGGANRARRRYDTQEEAIEAGREIAREEGTELYIHGEDGRVREMNSFEKDPFPPKG